MSENVLRVEIFLQDPVKDKNKSMKNESKGNETKRNEYKMSKKKQGEINKNVCALLNSGGGTLVLKASDGTATDQVMNADSIIRPFEQYFKERIPLFKVCNNFKIVEEEQDCIKLHIVGLSVLCTCATNLFLPSVTEIASVNGHDRDTIREILSRTRGIVEISEHEIPEQYLFNSNCGIRESKTVQFKHLKTQSTQKTDFVVRVINNKFTSTISAFANASGGYIFYGINDHGIVVGETFSNQKEIESIKNKLAAAVRKMIWPESSSEIKLGEQWDIQLVPVKNTIPFTFVIVVSVRPCFGGVFTKNPESYYVGNGNVAMEMPFDTWKENVFKEVEEVIKIPLQLNRNTWSHANEAEEYMCSTQHLEQLRQLGKFKRIENAYKTMKEKGGLSVNAQLIVIFQTIAVKYRKGIFEGEEFEDLREEFRRKIEETEDQAIFAVEERYSTSAIQRSQGEYEKAWGTIVEGLNRADQAPAGFVAANLFAQAASVLSQLVNDESFIGVSKDSEEFKKNVGEHVKRAENFCHMALQHLLYVENKFEDAKEELRQRVCITLAALSLKTIDTDHAPVSSSAIDTAAAKISEAEESLMKGKLLKYNYCRLLIVKSDLYFKKYQLEKSVDTRTDFVEQSLRFIMEAQKLATGHHFEEIKNLCKPREDNLEKILEELPKVKNDEK